MTVVRVRVRSTSPRFLRPGEEIELTREEARAVVAEGTAEYVTREAQPQASPREPGRHERRDMRARK
jgi:hypothetical protein